MLCHGSKTELKELNYYIQKPEGGLLKSISNTSRLSLVGSAELDDPLRARGGRVLKVSFLDL